MRWRSKRDEKRKGKERGEKKEGVQGVRKTQRGRETEKSGNRQR